MDLEMGITRTRARSNIVAQNLGNEYDIFDYDYQSFAASLVVGWQ
jgi:hypothetical protein